MTPTADTRRGSALRLGVALFLLYLLTAWAGPPLDAMAGREIALSEAFSHGRLRVNAREGALSGDFLYPDGPEGGGVSIAEFAGPLLFVPVSAVVQTVIGDAPESRARVVFVESVLYVALLSAFPAALAAVLVYLLALRLQIPGALPAGLLFGLTPLFPQACMVSPHPLSTALICAALFLLAKPERSRRESAAAGLAAGLAVLAYFGVLFAVVVPLGIYGATTGSWRARAAFVAGAAGPALALGLWNHLNYGAPWELPDLGSDAGDLGAVAARNVTFSLSLPSPRLVWELSVGTRRGLLVFAPVLALGFAGFKPLWKRRRSLALLLIAIGLATTLQAASKPLGWHGGSAAGPRYMIPAALVLSIPLGYALVSFPRLATGLGGVSFVFALCTSLTALYGSLRACLEEVLFMGPRLRWVYSVGQQLESLPSHGWAVALSATIALPLFALCARLLSRDVPPAQPVALAVALAWGVLAVRGGLVGSLGTSPVHIRHAEMLRLVEREPEPLRLRWYAGELLALGDAASACETSLRSIAGAGWEASPAAREVLGKALRSLEAEGRSSETRAFLQRAAALKAR